MADHGHVEYATATGNDLAAHEGTYEGFLQLAYVSALHVAVVVIGLGIIGTTVHWGIGVALIFAAGIIGSYCLASGTRTPGIVLVLIALLALGFSATT
jgi:hypothetical protein